jgi:hypothetical protein
MVKGQKVKCYNLSLRLATKARVCKVASKEGSFRIASPAPGVKKNVRE